MGFFKGTHRGHRTPARHAGNGIYEVYFDFPREGLYDIPVAARSLGITYGDLRHAAARVAEGKVNPDSKNTRGKFRLPHHEIQYGDSLRRSRGARMGNE